MLSTQASIMNRVALIETQSESKHISDFATTFTACPPCEQFDRVLPTLLDTCESRDSTTSERLLIVFL